MHLPGTGTALWTLSRFCMPTPSKSLHFFGIKSRNRNAILAVTSGACVGEDTILSTMIHPSGMVQRK